MNHSNENIKPWNKVHHDEIWKALNKQSHRLPWKLKQAFERSISFIKNKVSDILNTSWWDIDKVSSNEFENWVYSESKAMLYKEYLKFINYLWYAPVSIDEFKWWDSKLDKDGETVWKRFTIIRERWITRWTRVIKKWDKRIYSVVWLTNDLKLKLEWETSPVNPVNYISFDSLSHFKSEWILQWDIVVDKETWKNHKVIWITPMLELRLEWFKNPKNPKNFEKSNVTQLNKQFKKAA